MGEFVGRMGYYLAQPDKVIFAVATVLLYPVLFTEVASLIWTAFQAGNFTIEAFSRRRARKKIDLQEIADTIESAAAEDDAPKANTALAFFAFGPVLSPTIQRLVAKPLTRLRVTKIMLDAEQVALRRLDRTRSFIRIGPILGLMGTLIPISPALVGLAKGDTDTLAANLVVAFSTTVVGLLIGSISFLVSVARERMYTQDMSDLEYVLEKAA